MAMVGSMDSDGLPSATDFTRSQWIALLVMVCSAMSSQMVMPLWVGAVIEDFHLSVAAAGRVGSVELMSVAVVSLLMAIRIQAFPTRPTAAVGMILLILGNFLSAQAASEVQLILARMLCGVGKGLVVAIVFGLAAGCAKPTRAFALLNIVYALFSAAFYLTIPLAIKSGGAAGAFFCMGSVAVIGAAFIVGCPAERLVTNNIKGFSLKGVHPFGLFAFVALIILYSALNGIFTFVERFGVRTGIDVTAVGAVLSFSALIQIAAATLARMLDSRIGYGKLIGVALVINAVAMCLIGHVATVPVFMATVPAIMLMSTFISTLMLGIIALADRAGRLSAASSAAMTAGGSFGAWIGGVCFDSYGFVGLTWASLAQLVLFAVIIAGVAPLANRQSRIATH